MSGQREQAIRERAYVLWEQDGRPEGRSLAHWSRAEDEIAVKEPLGAQQKAKRAKPPRGRGAAGRLH